MKTTLSIALCALFSMAAFAADEAKGQSRYASEFVKHWKVAKELTLAVAEAMPAENYDFKPNPEEMSFGEQIAHIAAGNYAYCSRLTGGKSPFNKPEKYDQATVTKLVGESFDYCGEAIGAMTDDKLTTMVGPEGRQTSLREVTEAVLMHMAHHRGQTEVYLRIKGIKPPTYKF